MRRISIVKSHDPEYLTYLKANAVKRIQRSQNVKWPLRFGGFIGTLSQVRAPTCLIVCAILTLARCEAGQLVRPQLTPSLVSFFGFVTRSISPFRLRSIAWRARPAKHIAEQR